MFSKQEYANRLTKVRVEMESRGLDAYVIFDYEFIQGGGSIRYLTNYFLPMPFMAVLVITPQTTMLTVVPGMQNSERQLAQRIAVADQIGGDTPGAIMGSDMAGDIKRALLKANLAGKKVGVDGIFLVQEIFAKMFRDALSDFQVVEWTGIMDKVRLVKSAEEIKVIHEAARLADVAMNTFIKAVKVGKRLDHSISEAALAADAQGSEKTWSYMATGDDWTWGMTHGPQVYKKGDMVSGEFNSRSEGIYGQVCRSFVVGKASLEQRKACELINETYREMASIVKPGITASEIYEAGQKFLKKAGTEQAFRAGHGMGYSIGEGGSFMAGDKMEMQAGNYIMLHPVIPYGKVMILSGNSLLVTETGCEELNKANFVLEV